MPHLQKPDAAVLRPFLNPETVLVPVPRSAPLREGALWPSRVICDVLVEHGFGREVLPMLERIRALPKSSHSPAAERPLIHDHIDSMDVDKPLFCPDTITIVDDVLTMGRTSFSCAEMIRGVCPNADIRVFALIRTQGFVEDIDKIVDPSVGLCCTNRGVRAVSLSPDGLSPLPL